LRIGVNPKAGPTAFEFVKRAGISMVAENASDTTGPTPGIVISHAQTSSYRTIASMNGESYRLATSKKAQRRSAQGHGQNPKIPNEGELPPKNKSAQKHENKPGPQSPFLLTQLVHFLTAIWHNLSPPLTSGVSLLSRLPCLSVQSLLLRPEDGYDCAQSDQ
jgi:hypothetical protein